MDTPKISFADVEEPTNVRFIGSEHNETFDVERKSDVDEGVRVIEVPPNGFSESGIHLPVPYKWEDKGQSEYRGRQGRRSSSAGMEDEDPVTLGKASKELGRSAGTGGSFTSSHPNAIEVSETLKTKIYAMKWVWISIIFNALLIWLVMAMVTGFRVPFSASTATSLGCVLLELILILSNAITNAALDTGAAAYFGHRLASRAGYSLAACGYMQTSTIIEKMYFPSFLSLNSTCRSLLSRISSIWILLSALLILTPLSATSTHGYPSRKNEGTVPCVIFKDKGVMMDRAFPNVVVEMGISEMIFGTALGTPRSEFPVDETLALITPQIVGAVSDGDTLIGPGHSIKILTSCTCAPSSDEAGLSAADVPSSQINALLSGARNIGNMMGLSNHVRMNSTSKTVHITSMLTGTYLCGGSNASNPTVPVCNTQLFNFTNIQTIVSFMTDGTPASIAPKAAYIEESYAEANITWVYFAMDRIMDSVNGSSWFQLPSAVPGMVNPILYWLTPNLMQVDPTLLEAGLETTFAILLRAGAQRTFATAGQFCVHNVEETGVSILNLADYGVKTALVFSVLQLAISIFAGLCYLPWFLTEAPIGPAIRLITDSVYFTTLVHSSTLYNSETLCNAQPYVIWQALDIVVRIGETFRSRDEEIVGHITMDRPKFIAALTNGRKYN